MDSSQYARGITAEDLRILLKLWPSLAAEVEECHQWLIEVKEKVLGNDAAKFSWCHLYELPVKQHLNLI